MTIPCKVHVNEHIQYEGCPLGFGLLWRIVDVHFDARLGVFVNLGMRIRVTSPENPILATHVFYVTNVEPMDAAHWFEMEAVYVELIRCP